MINGKTCKVNVKRVVNVRGVILPLILFMFGILVPVVTEDFLFIALSFVPFYGHMIAHEKGFDESSIFIGRTVFAISFILGFLLSVLTYYGLFEFLEISGDILLVNVIPSFCFLIYIVVKVGSKNASLDDYSPPSS